MRRTIHEGLRDGGRRLDDAGAASSALDARLLMQHVLGVSTEWLIGHDDDVLQPADYERFMQLITRRATHEPLAYITGEKAFWKDTFLVTRDTLIPRADSETLIEAVLELLPDKRAPLNVLDLGTGTGCLLLSVLREYENAHGLGIDIHAPTITVASANAAMLHLNHRAQFALGDMNDEASLPRTPEIFDLIISNPPYIRSADMQGLQPDVHEHEPHRALDGGSSGLNFYVNLFKWLPKRMRPSSVVMFEVGHDQAQDVTALAIADGFSDTRTFHDLAGIGRVVTGRFS